MIVACAFDHAGFPLKELVLHTLASHGAAPLDLGTDSPEPVDYPDIALSACEAILGGKAERAVVVCGSGAGVAVACNKVPGIRATVAHDTYTAHQAVEHDDVNILCLGARIIGPALAAEIIETFARAQFSREERHQRRLDKVLAIEARFSPPPPGN